MIELGKKYRTRNGNEVRILLVGGGGLYPVIGAVHYQYTTLSDVEEWRWTPESWTDEGGYTGTAENPWDLVEAP